ncbi:MAG TPA: trehalose-phosphatase [Gemmatimonadaceae bacterium]|nr:trehalose-phosphatase [Gemmatimonadaceae bacterium]
MKASAEMRRRRTRAEPPAPRVDWAYFFDIDGTLVDIAPTPWEVRLERELLELLLRLHRATGGALALISGRSIADIDSIFHATRLPVAGQHGIERRDSRGRITRHRFPTGRLAETRAQLGEIVARHPGLLLEDKELSLALHYRQQPALGSYVHRLMRTVQAEIGPDYSVQLGKRIVELKPSGRDKGQAVQEFMAESPFKGRVPVFVGDDVTDEHGFEVVNALGGYSIKVGRGRSSARWRLSDVEAVRAWLVRGEQEQQGESEAAR